ncbi:MAG: HlyD family efflux transporter periplasmic adaptor subunit [Saprospiraceae bacterium]|nr:HlyD family efflux transporter periplasmic adaptor subunit [Saprospiraceae bacterium]
MQRSIGQFLDSKNEPHTQKALQMLDRQTATLESSNQSLDKQINTLKKEVDLAERHATLMQQLYEKGASSEEDKENAEAAYLRYLRELEAKKSEILVNRLSIERIGSERVGLERNADERFRTETLLLKERAARLLAAIQVWKQNYCLIAPVPGVVFTEGAWASQQYIQAGAPAFTILPASSSVATARTFIAPEGLGKVKPGAPVQLRLDAFPYKEYGVLEGVVRNISPVPSGIGEKQMNYLAEIELTGNLVTTYGITLPSQQEMPATARIITEKRSLLARIFDQFLDAYYNRE